MGKPIKQADMVQLIGQHYEVVEFDLLFKPATNGTNCAIMINGRQAVAGVAYDKGKKTAQPSKDECALVSTLAHTIAQHEYDHNHPDRTLPKKLTGEQIRGS